MQVLYWDNYFNPASNLIATWIRSKPDKKGGIEDISHQQQVCKSNEFFMSTARTSNRTQCQMGSAKHKVKIWREHWV